MQLDPRKEAPGDRARNSAVDIATESASAVEGAGAGAGARTRAAWVAAGACLLLLGLGGAALLVWWALTFHQSNQQLWMVPVSLVLLGTPVITWLSIFTSGARRQFDRMQSATAEPAEVEPER